VPGETLPPVVIPVEGDDSDFLAMLDRDVAALRDAAGEIDGLLASLDLGAALSDSLGSANLGSLNTDEIAQGLSEAMGGVGTALGEDVGSELDSALTEAGIGAGTALAEGMAEGASGAGDVIAQEVTEGLAGPAGAAGAEAGEALAVGFEGPFSLLGSEIMAMLSQGLQAGLPEIDAAVASVMRQLPSVVDADATYAGLHIGAALALGVTTAGSAAGGIATALTVSAVEAAGEAGTAAGAALAAGITDGLAGSLAATGGEAADEVESSLADALAQAGSAAGGSLAAGIADGAGGDADDVAVKISEAMQASLETTMVDAGKAAGDSFGTGLVEGVGNVADDVATDIADALKAPLQSAMTEVAIVAGDTFAQSLEVTAPTAASAAGVVAQEAMAELKEESVAGAEEAATAAGEAYVFQYGATVKMSWANVAASRASFDTPQQPEQEWVSQIDAMNLTSVAQAQAAAARAAAQAETDALVGTIEADEEILQGGIESFLELSDASLEAWMAEVETAASSSTSAFIETYGAINAQLDATTALTERQAQALEYLYVNARSEMQALQAEATTLNESSAVSASTGFAPTQGADLVGAGIGTAGRELGAVSEAAGDAAGAVEKTTGAFGGLGAMAMGPAGMGLMALTSVLPMLGSLFDSNAVSASQFTSAVTQDSGAVGDNTAATIQQALAKSNLGAMSGQLGVSQATLIEYAAGETAAQNQVTSAVTSQTEALNKNVQYVTIHGQTVAESGTAADKLSESLSSEKQRLDAVTGAVQQAIQQDQANSQALLAAEQTTTIYNAAVNALGESMLQQVETTKMSNQATAQYGSQVLFAESSLSYMNAAMGATVATSRESALTNAYASVALLGLGTSQSELNGQLSAGEAAYTEAVGGANAYSAALNSLNGTATSLAQAQNTLDGDMVSAKTTFDANSDSLSKNTQAGVNDREALVSASQAIVAMGVAQFQSSGNINEANRTIQQQIDAFVNSTGATGRARQAILNYLDSITKIPPDVSTTVHVNTSQAMSSLGAVLTAENSVGTSATVDASEIAHQLDHKATGGPVEAGRLYDVNESGAEGFFVPPANGFIVPHDQMASLGGSGGGGSGAPTGGTYGGGGGAAPIHVTVLVDGKEIAAVVAPAMRSDVNQYKFRNSQSGFG
jgi:hypothetical protein